jgi:hypothetical protein
MAHWCGNGITSLVVPEADDEWERFMEELEKTIQHIPRVDKTTPCGFCGKMLSDCGCGP